MTWSTDFSGTRTNLPSVKKGNMGGYERELPGRTAHDHCAIDTETALSLSSKHESKFRNRSRHHFEPFLGSWSTLLGFLKLGTHFPVEVAPWATDETLVAVMHCLTLR